MVVGVAGQDQYADSADNTDTMSAEKQIRVSNEMRDELHGMKGVGESYDDVLRQPVQEHNRRELADRTPADRSEVTTLCYPSIGSNTGAG